MGSGHFDDGSYRYLDARFRPKPQGQRRTFASQRPRRRNDYLVGVGQLIQHGARAVANLRSRLGFGLAKRREVAFYRTQQATLKRKQAPSEILVSSEVIVEVYEGFDN